MNLKIIIRWGVSHFLNLWNWRQQIGESLHISLLRLGRVWVIENRYQDTHWLFSLSFVPKMSRISGQDDMILDSWWQPIKFPDIHQSVTLRQILSEIYLSLSPTRLWHCGCPTNWCGRRAGWWWTRPRTGARRARSTSVLTILRWGKHQSFVFLIEKNPPLLDFLIRITPWSVEIGPLEEFE